MSILLAMVCLSNLVPLERSRERPSLRLFVVSQRKFKNHGHHPWNNRRVTFRLVNDSDQAVIVYGTKFDFGFEPTGYVLSLNSNTSEWECPNTDNSPTPWNELSADEKDRHVLKPGEHITFEAEMSVFEVGMHFKRTIYVSMKEGEQPREIRGQEFVLK